MGYFFLFLTIVSESAAVILMKLSGGFQKKTEMVIAFICYALSFVFLTLALKSLPAGLANALWAGTSTVLVAVLGIFIFKEHLNIAQVIFLALIVIGLTGLNLSKTQG